MKRTCPKCHAKALRLYQNKTVDGKRSWVPTAWYCTSCEYTYFVASDTLIYSAGGEAYLDRFKKHCPKCDKSMHRMYHRRNPKHGKQEWISSGYYCDRCRYIWMDSPK